VDLRLLTRSTNGGSTTDSGDLQHRKAYGSSITSELTLVILNISRTNTTSDPQHHKYIIKKLSVEVCTYVFYCTFILHRSRIRSVQLFSWPMTKSMWTSKHINTLCRGTGRL
jgi:hypothetical protein